MRGTVLLLTGLFLCGATADGEEPPRSERPPATDAANRARAKEEFLAAGQAFDQKKWEEALIHFRMAREYAPDSPKPHLFVARTLAELGRCLEAVQSLAEVDRLAPNGDPLRADAAAVRTFCEPALQPHLLLRSTPPGASVWVDDRKAPETALTPLELATLPPGRHRIRVGKQGFQTSERTLELRLGETATVAFTLEPVASPPPPPVASTTPVTPPPVPPTVVARPPVTPPPPPPRVAAPAPELSPSARRMRYAGVGLLVAGVLVGAGGGIATSLIGPPELCPPSSSIQCLNAPGDNVGSAAASSKSTNQALFIASVAGGGALALTGAVLLGLSFRDPARTRTSVYLAPSLDGTGAHLVVSGTLP